jgi:hypothetical protein
MINILISKKVFIAHCWSTCTGNSKHLHLDLNQKIINAIKGIPEVCCSSIQSGDTIHYNSDSGPCNFWEPIRVIIMPGLITLAKVGDAATPNSAEGYRTSENAKEMCFCRMLMHLDILNTVQFSVIRSRL